MDWDFTENIAFKALYEAFKDSDETSALEFYLVMVLHIIFS